MNLPRRTLILYIAAAIVFLGAAYYYLVFTHVPDTTVVSSDVVATQAELDFIALVQRVDPIQFDLSILSNPRFTALQDIRTAVVPEAAGRKDPFAPYAGASK